MEDRDDIFASRGMLSPIAPKPNSKPYRASTMRFPCRLLNSIDKVMGGQGGVAGLVELLAKTKKLG